MKTKRRTITLGAAAIAIVASFLAGVYVAGGYRTPRGGPFGVSDAVAAPEAIPGSKAASAPAPNIVELLETQLKAVKVEVASEREFPIEKSAVGSIDFNEEMLTQVFTPYQGRIVELFAKVGDEVKKGQALFTIDSPDLVQKTLGFRIAFLSHGLPPAADGVDRKSGSVVIRSHTDPAGVVVRADSVHV